MIKAEFIIEWHNLVSNNTIEEWQVTHDDVALYQGIKVQVPGSGSRVRCQGPGSRV